MLIFNLHKKLEWIASGKKYQLKFESRILTYLVY